MGADLETTRCVLEAVIGGASKEAQSLVRKRPALQLIAAASQARRTVRPMSSRLRRLILVTVEPSLWSMAMDNVRDSWMLAGESENPSSQSFTPFSSSLGHSEGRRFSVWSGEADSGADTATVMAGLQKSGTK